MSKSHSVSIQIMGKEYQIACPPEEKRSLIEAAEYLDKQMRGIRDGGKVIGLERIAVMAALNSCHELLAMKSTNSDQVQGSQSQLQRMDQKLDSALNRLKQLEI